MINNTSIKNNQKGITLIALAITIIVLLILATITINIGINLKEDAKKNEQLSELSMIQQAILEQYTKYKLVKNDENIIGKENKLEFSEVESIVETINSKIEGNITLKVSESNYESLEAIEKYYKIGNNELEKMGIENASEDVEYIINYSTGEVINSTELVTHDNQPLYVYAVNNQ